MNLEILDVDIVGFPDYMYNSTPYSFTKFALSNRHMHTNGQPFVFTCSSIRPRTQQVITKCSPSAI